MTGPHLLLGRQYIVVYPPLDLGILWANRLIVNLLITFFLALSLVIWYFLAFFLIKTSFICTLEKFQQARC